MDDDLIKRDQFGQVPHTSHGLDVFGCDAHVEELDLELPISEVVDRCIFAVVFAVGAGAVGCCDEGVVRRSPSLRRSIGLCRSAGSGLLLRCHVVVSEQTAGGRQNCWCKIPFGGKRYHNSPVCRGRSIDREMSTRIMA